MSDMSISSPQIDSEGCFICGETRQNSLETHHIVPQRYGGSDEPENLVQLCASCHSAIEKLYDERFYNRIHQLFNEGSYASWEDDLELKTFDAEESLDRDIPISSEHVKFQSEAGGEWAKAIREKEKLQNSSTITGPSYLFDDKVMDDDLSEERREAIEKSEEWFPKWETIDDDRSGQTQERALKKPETGKVWYKNKRASPSEILEAIHCGYCNAWFEYYEMAAAARHLRIAHGIENPYEEPDPEPTAAQKLGLGPWKGR